MRQPTFSRARHRRRHQRLLRTAVGAVVLIALFSLVGNLITGKPAPSPAEMIAFKGFARATSDGKAAASSAAATEAGEVRRVLDDWYQSAFVDPKLYGDGTFPNARAHFTKDAKASFTRDLASLTIAQAREDVASVHILQSLANVTVFFAKGTAARFAVAEVRFHARAALKDKDARPLDIVQTAKYHFEKSGGDWVVTYYDSKQDQNSVTATATPTTR